MAPNKFEQHIKEELNKRKIKPSSNAWNKIALELDNPKKQRKPIYLWWGIAASFAGLLIISTIYFNNDTNDTIDSHTVVGTDKKNIEIIENENDSLTDKPEKNHIANKSITKQEGIEVMYNNTKSIEPNYKLQKNEIVQIAIVNSQSVVDTKKAVFSQEELIQQKIAEVVAKVDELEQNKTTLTDIEVDSLILQAQKEILHNKMFRQDRSVDAMALLNEVEGELDEPLKNKLFELLKKGIFETKNALADRN